MNAIKMAARMLGFSGFLGQLYGSFSCTRQTWEAERGTARTVVTGEADGRRTDLVGSLATAITGAVSLVNVFNI